MDTGRGHKDREPQSERRRGRRGRVAQWGSGHRTGGRDLHTLFTPLFCPLFYVLILPLPACSVQPQPTSFNCITACACICVFSCVCEGEGERALTDLPCEQCHLCALLIANQWGLWDVWDALKTPTRHIAACQHTRRHFPMHTHQYLRQVSRVKHV